MTPLFNIDNLILFFDYVRITGVFYLPGRNLKAIQALHDGRVVGKGAVNLPAPGLDQDCRFVITFLSGTVDPRQLTLRFELDNGYTRDVACADVLARQQANAQQLNHAERGYFDQIKLSGYDRVLEIGSRARSGVVRRHLFAGKQYTGLDILEGPNVDVVGDAHCLTDYFADESFDAVYSIFTFEHLAMPWKVALELNKVMRRGAVAYFQTHQALGMHDLPWDFWRYSDTAWNGIFNQSTGFRVLHAYLGQPMALVPHIYDEHWIGYEAAAGFAVSAVLVEKTGNSDLRWDLNVREAIQGVYPA